MEVLGLLKAEDDNPRGQGRGLFISGATLEEVEAAEERRKQIQAEKLSFAKQEAGILHLLQAKNHFARLKLPEPRWTERGEPIWECSARALNRVYDEAKKCCHPEWSYHPKRKQGFELLTAAFDTLSDRNGKRDEYVRQFVREARERERLLRELQKGLLDGPEHAPASSTRDADELREQMAAKTKRMLEESRAKKLTAAPVAAAVGAQPGPSQSESAPRRRYGRAAAEQEDEPLLDDEEASGPSMSGAQPAAREQKSKKKRRVGVF